MSKHFEEVETVSYRYFMDQGGNAVSSVCSTEDCAEKTRVLVYTSMCCEIFSRETAIKATQYL